MTVRQVALRALLIGLLASLALAPAAAREAGVAGRTSGCTACHGGSNGSAGFSIVGVSRVFEGETLTYEARVASNAFPDGVCGVDVRASSGVLSESSAQLKLLSSEVVHSAPIPFGGAPSCGDFFEWTAPAADLSPMASLIGAGLSANGNGSSTGDISATGSKAIEVFALSGDPELLLEAVPDRVFEGQATTLHWRTDGVATCEASGDWTGSRPAGLGLSAEVTPTALITTYRLRCTTLAGSVTVERSVTVQRLGAAVTPPGGFPVSNLIGVEVPLAMVSAPDASLLLANLATVAGDSLLITLEGETVPLGDGGSVALDGGRSPLYYEASSGLVSRLDTRLARLERITELNDGGSDPRILATGGDLIYSDSAGIQRLDPATGSQEQLIALSEIPGGRVFRLGALDLEADGSLLIESLDISIFEGIFGLDRLTPAGQLTRVAQQLGHGFFPLPTGGVLLPDCANDRVVRDLLDGSPPEVLIAAEGDGENAFLCPSELAVDVEGDVYALADDGAVWRIADDGTSVQLLADGLSPGGVAKLTVDGAGNVYLAGSGQQLVRISTRVFAIADATDGVDQPGALAADDQGNVYVTSAASNEVYRISPEGDSVLYMDDRGIGLPLPGVPPAGSPTMRLIPLEQPHDVAVGPDQSVYVGFAEPGEVIRVLPDGTSETFATGSGAPNLAVASDGAVYVAFAGDDAVVRHPTGGGSSVAIGPEGDGAGNVLDAPSALAVDPGGTVYVSGASSHNVLKRSGDLVSLVLDGTGDGTHSLVGPSGLAVGPSSELFVSGSQSDNVFRIDADGSVSQVLDASGNGLGAELKGPGRPSVDASGVLYVPGVASNNLFDVRFDGPSGSQPAVRRAVAATGDGVEMLGAPEASTAAPGGGVYFSGRDSDNVFFYRPFEAMPIPEPGHAAAVLAAVSALAGLRRLRAG